MAQKGQRTLDGFLGAALAAKRPRLDAPARLVSSTAPAAAVKAERQPEPMLPGSGTPADEAPSTSAAAAAAAPLGGQASGSAPAGGGQPTELQRLRAHASR